jgi:hypothetical protein
VQDRGQSSNMKGRAGRSRDNGYEWDEKGLFACIMGHWLWLCLSGLFTSPLLSRQRWLGSLRGREEDPQIHPTH